MSVALKDVITLGEGGWTCIREAGIPSEEF